MPRPSGMKSRASVSTGVNADGHREILGIDICSAESEAGWLTLFRGLNARGLTGVKLVTSDAHSGLVAAVGATMGGASWQRCRTHYAANLMAICPKQAWPGVKALLHSVYDQPDAKAVHAQFDKLLDTVADKLPEVHDHLDEARADILAFTAFPKEISPAGRTCGSRDLPARSRHAADLWCVRRRRSRAERCRRTSWPRSNARSMPVLATSTGRYS